EAFSPINLVQSVAELLSPKAADKGVEIAAYVDAGVPAMLYGDEARLRQVLINLAGNGVKFTDHGGVAIEARLLSAENGVANVVFSVRDTGVGIPADKQATIFEEFSQGDTSGARKREGAGLGLAISRKIVRAMGGDIALASTVGEGSVFTFAVSLDYEGEAPKAPVSFETPVIIAARSPVLTRSLELQLAAIGAGTVVVAQTPAAAMAAIEAHPGAILLCDIYVAGESAHPLAKNAAQSYVLLSPLARGRIAELREAGFGGYFIKPIRQTSLHKQLIEDCAPKPDAAAQTTAAKPQKSAPDPRAQKTFRVLLAEDNQINAVLATTIIKRAGHQVDVARNGAEAVKRASVNAYDVILMDMHMPEVDGLEATRRIRRLDGPARRAPIIALTANAMASDRQKCIAAGMDDFLSKPFEPADLTALLAKWGETESQWSEAS
ncbi:MAG: response regulator, partial [Parvularculaceae bacterium]